MKYTSLNDLIYQILLKHDAPGVRKKHTADVIAQQVQYHINDQTNTSDSWSALSSLCQEAKVSVIVLSGGGYHVTDDHTGLHTKVDMKEDVINIIQSRIEYFESVSGYNWV